VQTDKGKIQTRDQRILKARNILMQTIIHWGLIEDGEIITRQSSLLQPVIFEGTKAMLKVAMIAEERRGSALMVGWNGDGSAKVFKHQSDILLMERAIAPKSLRQMVLNGSEVEANKIVCGVVAKLHGANCRKVDDLVPLKTWFSGLGHANAKYGGLFGLCSTVADELLNNPMDIVALHGDIHYDNILDSGKNTWVAIDPKALLGERGFDYANLFCNPTRGIALSETRLRKQVKLIAAEAGLDVTRLLQWIVAWSGLSAAWMLDDGENAQVPLTVAENALRELAAL
jgi:streptomycin 6-kinase